MRARCRGQRDCLGPPARLPTRLPHAATLLPTILPTGKAAHWAYKEAPVGSTPVAPATSGLAAASTTSDSEGEGEDLGLVPLGVEAGHPLLYIKGGGWGLGAEGRGCVHGAPSARGRTKPPCMQDQRRACASAPPPRPRSLTLRPRCPAAPQAAA